MKIRIEDFSTEIIPHRIYIDQIPQLIDGPNQPSIRFSQHSA